MLEQIKKEHIFETPERYFEKLPGVIEARTRRPVSILSWPVFVGSLKYALPVVLIIVGVVIWNQSEEAIQYDAEKLIAEMSTDDLLNYVEYNNLVSHDIAQIIELSAEEIDEIVKDQIQLFDESTDEDMLLEYLDDSDFWGESII